MSYVSSRGRKGKLQKHTVMVRRKVATAIAFSTTIMLICIESAKSFAIPNAVLNASLLIESNTLSLFCSTSNRFAERFKLSTALSRRQSVRPMSNNGYGTSKTSRIDPVARSHLEYNFNWQKFSSTSLRMSSGASKSPAMLDMKTSIGAFGGWYNELDPVARPSTYDEDDVTDYTFASRSDSWLTSNLDSYNDRYTTTTSPLERNRTASERANPSPIRAIRRLAGWVFRIKPVQKI